MSERNKATLKKANAAISAGDHEGFLVHCTEDTEWIFVGDQTLKGKKAVRRWMKTAYVKPPRFKVARLIAGKDFVVALGEIMLKASGGKDARHAYCDVWRFRRGKLAELRAFVVKVKARAKRRSRSG
jgi:ketosteroid isomerase-like protein